MTTLAFDTSAAVPLLVRSHDAHLDVRRHATGRAWVLTAHSQLETYSVLTRLPGDARVEPADAVRLLDAAFGTPVLPDPEDVAHLPATLAAAGIAGGAVYDALVGLTARTADVPLLTRDARALATYSRLGVTVELVAG
ncbi:PIN domain-containing protein [Modestobacter sp. I12A-02628]|uniref:Ribonuclease VapC n=1 Tax=Goekera deserti TaxID=2497753 RepID=A0A7K3WFD1_9ACTN|nr:PIN domain-containing protein [Goekera deserti]MPQ97899.1 PIN domain-containing protein [Goekera deserti]NDI48545.1 PIN domain-containing protein [Goekera deserti]NEL55076.1 type II toxin-antitoxin system VapC family toxin [Goekera deserti]